MVFLEIVKALNQKNIVPILYGSLGLYRIIGQLDKISDIDIIIPNENLTKQFDELMKIMAKIGYKQDPHCLPEFTKGKERIDFEPESDLEELGINPKKLKITEIGDSRFKELSQEDYLLAYRRNLKTWEMKVEKIKQKIRTLAQKI